MIRLQNTLLGRAVEVSKGMLATSGVAEVELSLPCSDEINFSACQGVL